MLFFVLLILKIKFFISIIQIFLENCDENLFPIDVLQRIDFISIIENRIRVLHELENFYRTDTINDQICDKLIDKILFQLTKFNPPNYGLKDIEFISIYLRLLVQINKMTIDVIAEFIYWYLEGGEQIR